MNILYVAHERNLGGASKSLVTMVSDMKQRGHTVAVILPFRSGQVGRSFKEAGIPVKHVFFGWWMMPEVWNPLLKFLFRVLYLTEPLAVRRIAFFAKKNHIQLIHSNSSAIDAGARAALKCALPHVWHFREFGDIDYGLSYLRGREESMRRARIVPGKIVFISKCLRHYYEKEIPDACAEVIYNGISEKYLNEKYAAVGNETDITQMNSADKVQGQQADKVQWQQADQVQGQQTDNAQGQQTDKVHGQRTVTFLIAGNFHEGKHQELAIEACRILHEQGFGGFLLLIAGAPSALKSSKVFEAYLREKARELPEGMVIFTGHVSDMVKLRKTTDVELVCSGMEAFGRVTAEAMLSSNPVIGADSGATPELITDGENGFLFESGNADALADKMRYFLEYPKEVSRMGRNACRYAKEHFPARLNTDAVELLYRELLGEDKR